MITRRILSSSAWPKIGLTILHDEALQDQEVTIRDSAFRVLALLGTVYRGPPPYVGIYTLDQLDALLPVSRRGIANALKLLVAKGYAEVAVEEVVGRRRVPRYAIAESESFVRAYRDFVEGSR